MKKVYTAPKLEMEIYQLNGNIANNCGSGVTNGPETIDHPACEDFPPIFPQNRMLRSIGETVVFDDKSCHCTTTGGDGAFWQS